MINLKKAKLKAVQLFRPFIGENILENSIRKVLELGQKYVLCTAYCGLNMSPALKTLYSKKWPKISRVSLEYGDYIPPRAMDLLLSIAQKDYSDHPVYRHTSCAFSAALQKHDYNATMYNNPICRNQSYCLESQRKRCIDYMQRKTVTAEEIKDLLKKIGKEDVGYRIERDKIILTKNINQEDYCFLLQNLSFPLKMQEAEIIYTRLLRGSIIPK